MEEERGPGEGSGQEVQEVENVAEGEAVKGGFGVLTGLAPPEDQACIGDQISPNHNPSPEPNPKPLEPPI